MVVVGFIAQGEGEGGVSFHGGVIDELEKKERELVGISAFLWTDLMLMDWINVL